MSQRFLIPWAHPSTYAVGHEEDSADGGVSDSVIHLNPVWAAGGQEVVTRADMDTVMSILTLVPFLHPSPE